MNKKSLLAGILVGIGVLVNYNCENAYVGAFLFSLALISIIKFKLNLYTGKIGFVNLPISTYFGILDFNIIGILLVTFPYCAEFVDKLDQPYMILLFKGIMCGILMHIAVCSESKLIIVMCIMAFILSGFEHCIADIPYAFTHCRFIEWTCVFFGNSIGAVLTNILLGRDE